MLLLINTVDVYLNLPTYLLFFFVISNLPTGITFLLFQVYSLKNLSPLSSSSKICFCFPDYVLFYFHRLDYFLFEHWFTFFCVCAVKVSCYSNYLSLKDNLFFSVWILSTSAQLSLLICSSIMMYA